MKVKKAEKKLCDIVINNAKKGPLRCIGLGKSERPWMGSWC